MVMKGTTDPGHNFVFEVHEYLGSDSSGQSASCVSTTIGAERLQDLTAWLCANGYRAFLGELGAAANDTCNQAVGGPLTFVQSNTDVWTGSSWWAGGPWWDDYTYPIEPANGVDKPQISVLMQYLKSLWKPHRLGVRWRVEPWTRIPPSWQSDAVLGVSAEWARSPNAQSAVSIPAQPGCDPSYALTTRQGTMCQHYRGMFK